MWRELRLDLKFYAFKIVFEPLFLVAIGVTLHSLDNQFEHVLLPPVRELLGGPWVLLDHVWGPIYLTIFTVLLVDFSAYINHWVSHRAGPFWEFHKVHHRARYLSPLTRYRVHPVSFIVHMSASGATIAIGWALFKSIYYIPDVPALITPLEMTILLFYVVGHIRHTHYWISYGPWLSRILISPAMHQIHHSRLARHEGKNLGVIFSFWDSIFGTLYIPKTKERFAIGPEPDSANPILGLWQELITPLPALLPWKWKTLNSRLTIARELANPESPRDRLGV